MCHVKIYPPTAEALSKRYNPETVTRAFSFAWKRQSRLSRERSHQIRTNERELQ